MWSRCTLDSNARRSAGSNSGASSEDKQNRRGQRAGQMHKPQRHADRQHLSKPAVSNSKPAHVSQDFPFANARGVCIKCGDGWLIGSWQCRPEYDLLPMNNGSRLDKKFDELAGKRVCDSCHKRHPLARHMFQLWKPEVTDESVRLVNRQAEASYIDPAKAAATLFTLGHSSDSSGSSHSDSSISSGGSTSMEPGGAHTVAATLLNSIFNTACSVVEKRAESAAVVSLSDVLKTVIHTVCTRTASQDKQSRRNRYEHAREVVDSVISGVFTEIDERARLHQLTTWYDIGNFKYTSPKNYDFRDGRDALFDFECWTRIGPFCDAPNAVPILASDVPDFLRNTRWAGQGPKGIFDDTSEVYSRPVNRNGVQTCFGAKFCNVRDMHSHCYAFEIDEKVTWYHRHEGCVLHAGNLHAAYAGLHAAEAGGAYLGCSICDGTCTCKRAHAAY